MTGLESIISLIASVLAILGSLFLAARYIGRKIDKRFDRWIETTVENTDAMRRLTARVDNLEHTIGRNNQ